MSFFKDGEPQEQITVQDLGSTSVRSVFENGTPRHADLKVGHSIYERLSDQSLQLYKSELADGTTELFAIAETVDGERLNALMYFPAPSKVFGLDTDDILEDWEKLYKPGNENLLKGHRHIPNWSVFETERGMLWDAILSYKRTPQVKTDDLLFVPILAWKKTADGKFVWQIDRQKVRSLNKVIAAHLEKGTSSPENRYSLLVGSLLAASYAPELTTTWEKELTFQLAKKKQPAEKEQNMGSTQALPLVLAWSEQLLESDFIINLEMRMGLAGKPRIKTPTEEVLEVIPLLPANVISGAVMPGTEKLGYSFKLKDPSQETKLSLYLTGNKELSSYVSIFMKMLSDEPASNVLLKPPENTPNPLEWYKSLVMALKKFKEQGLITDQTYTSWMSLVYAYLLKNSMVK